MGIAKRSLEPEEDFDEDVENAGEPTARCALCSDVGLAAGFRRCGGCGGSFCALTCCTSCSVCKRQDLCEDCREAECPECGGVVCDDCGLLAEVCAGCSRPLCGGDSCGGRCVDCGSLACRGCSVAVYDQRETQRRCLDCAVLPKRRRLGEALGEKAEVEALRRAYAEEAIRKLSKAHCRRAFSDEEDLFAQTSSSNLLEGAGRKAKAARLEVEGTPAPRTPPRGALGEAPAATPPRVARATVVAVKVAESAAGKKA